MSQQVNESAPKPGPSTPAAGASAPALAATPAATPESTSAPEEPKLFTQADLDRIIGQRLAPMKEKADAFDKAQEAAKSEAQRQADALAAAQAENMALKAAEARRQAALTAGLSPEASDLVTGSTPEEIDASVKKVQAALKATQPVPHKPLPDPSQHRQVIGGATGGSTSVRESRDRFAARYNPINK